MLHSTRKSSLAAILLAAMIVMAAVPRFAFSQGESAVPFMLIAPNARADGMGEAGTGIADDPSAAFWNPAGLAFQDGQNVSLTHSNWLPQFQQADLFYDYFVYTNSIPDIGGTISAQIIYLNLGEFNVTTISPDVVGTFKGYEVAVTGGYSTKLTSELGLGINLKYIRSVLAPFDVQGQGREGIGSSAAFDIAFMWRPNNLSIPLLGDLEDRFSFGFNLTNLGPKITYIDEAQADPLPTTLRIGFGYKILKSQFNNATFNVDFSRLMVRQYPAADSLDNPTSDNLPKSLVTAWGDGGLTKVDVGGGMEYWYGYPKLLAIRFGYFYEDPSAGGRKFMTFGAGIRYDVYGFDFSYLDAVDENSPLSETLRFTLSIGWGGPDQQQ
jgi:hypothetical protein